MFRHAWETRRAQAAEIGVAGQRKIESLEKEINKTLDHLISTGNDAVIASYEQRVADLEKEEALEFILTRKTISNELSTELIRSLNTAHGLFPGEIRRSKSSDLDKTKEMIRTGKLALGREYYLRALDIAKLIISEKSVSFDRIGDDIELGTFMVNFEVLFEDYLRNALRLRCRSETQVLDGNSSGRKPLFDDKSSPPAQPDIVLRAAGSASPLIIEVKYKEKPNRNDINQAITYANSYKSRNVVLLHQSGNAGQKGMKHLGTINSVSLYGYAFDLASANLEAEEKAMTRAFEKMLETETSTSSVSELVVS